MLNKRKKNYDESLQTVYEKHGTGWKSVRKIGASLILNLTTRRSIGSTVLGIGSQIVVLQIAKPTLQIVVYIICEKIKSIPVRC